MRQRVAGYLTLAGLMSLSGGLLYLPVGHPFARLLALYALAGGGIGLYGAALLHADPPSGARRRALQHLTALSGLALYALGQLPPLVVYAGLLRRHPQATLPMIGHGALFLVALAALLPAARLVLAERVRRSLWVTALAGVTAITVSPFAMLWLWSSVWSVTADPPPGSEVPLDAVFRFTWPAWQGVGTTGYVAYVDATGAREYVESVTRAGFGRLIVTPEPLAPGRELEVMVCSGLRCRQFRYRTVPAVTGRAAPSGRSRGPEETPVRTAGWRVKDRL
ncbi:hypothetical protein [Caldinitratiruptor microaerophilus]|uniref:Uncharacterized protein n=1 Tax=Caldinitratiruptor microaerophilus TaxID=671077 RepID=A0AA35CHV2_9FIRM|nr:hypothetical protein [Caldinitratiruptor microaerophilus]BDG59197.1 hypothetical protein caldi_02870 [Caldinitratiruptor microaerophilus]